MPDFTFAADREIAWNEGGGWIPAAARPALLFLDDVQVPARPLAVKADLEGMPLGPALKLKGGGRWTLLWPVDPGERTISVWCKHGGDSPPPRLRVSAAPDLGLSNDVSAQATASTDWQKLEITVSVVSRGVLEVHLEASYHWQEVYWDLVGAG